MFEEFEGKEVQEQMEKNQERLEQLEEQRAQQSLEKADAVLKEVNAFLAKEKGMTPEEHFEMIQLENAEKDPEYAEYLAKEQLAQKKEVSFKGSVEEQAMETRIEHAAKSGNQIALENRVKDYTEYKQKEYEKEKEKEAAELEKKMNKGTPSFKGGTQTHLCSATRRVIKSEIIM